MTPDAYTNQELLLEVGNGHQLYIHDWGNLKAKLPIIKLHGGPGGASRDSHKQLFNPDEQRIIFYDQRGCGRSLPYGDRNHNTTKELIGDLEKIAEYLKLESFMLVGGSWGSCLALAYTIKHPKRVKKVLISGVFTGSQQEIDYIDNGLFRTHFPEVWETLLEETPKQYHADPITYHVQRLFGDDPAAAAIAGRVYSEVEGKLVSIDDRFTPRVTLQTPIDLEPIKIEVEYLRNRVYLPDRYILDNAHKIKIPVWIVQGRYDFVCPPITASELHKALPNSKLIWTQAGHGSDRSNFEVMRALILEMA